VYKKNKLILLSQGRKRQALSLFQKRPPNERRERTSGFLIFECTVKKKRKLSTKN
jgi:hypothetical protein